MYVISITKFLFLLIRGLKKRVFCGCGHESGVKGGGETNGRRLWFSVCISRRVDTISRQNRGCYTFSEKINIK